MDFDCFLRQICPLLDLNWRRYRRRTARHRVEARMRELGMGSLASYREFLDQHPEEAANLPDLMRITVTRFFRDRPSWNYLARAILPDIIAAKSNHTVKVWSAGCCGGEEPYTMAILWLEYLRPLFPHYQMEILATDIDDESLERARNGSYSASSLREVPVDLLETYFQREGKLWTVKNEVRELVSLRKRNLMTDSVPSQVDIISCRYLVFTYYRGHRRAEAAKRIWGALLPKRILMIGRKEEISPCELALFAPIEVNMGIYQKINNCSLGS